MITFSLHLLAQVSAHRSSLKKWVSLCLALFLSYGCRNINQTKPVVDLKINSVQQAGSPGAYSVTGSTNLLEASKINVMAIRYLRSVNEDFLGNQTNANYSILARKTVDVKQGKWQANLNLWNVAPDGRLQEAWQAHEQDGDLGADTQRGVTFVATFTPPYKPNPNQPEFKGVLVRFTSTGNEYVQASKTVPVALPTVKVAAPVLKAEDINGGWGDRTKLPPQSIISKTTQPSATPPEQTNAPLSASEFLR